MQEITAGGNGVKKTANQLKSKTPPQKDLLERCHRRWGYIFWGCVRALNRHDPRLTVGLLKSLERTGAITLDEGGLFITDGELFDLNPSDDTLAKAKAFYENPNFPNLKWQRLPWEKPSPFGLLMDYSSILFELNKLFPDFSKVRTLHRKKQILKDKLPSIIEHIPGRKEVSRILADVTDGNLTKWANLSKKDLLVNLVAHIYGLTVPNTRKYLTMARKRHPREAKWWKHGCEMIRSK